MISDFFHPNVGGVENHIMSLSKCLEARGHRVVIVTHAYLPAYPAGVHRVNGLKVYYLPNPVMYNQVTWPSVVARLPWLRWIVKTEQIDLIHGHQAFSTMAHEALMHAATLGVGRCFTDHSLFGFADGSSILTNKLLKFTLSLCDQVICVSNTSKENTVLRAALKPESVYVIPNAISSEVFTPAPEKPRDLTVVILSRLVYRKGVDLLVAIIPRICSAFPHVRFLIAGDGPKKIDLEQMRERSYLQDRVIIRGAVPPEKAPEVLREGHIFLNTSLTEAFCMAIVEAACTGLYVVTTRVGGIPEVLPSDMMALARPEEEDLVRVLSQAIENYADLDCSDFHQRVSAMYSWQEVAARTEKVYQAAMRVKSVPLVERFRRVYGVGECAGKIFCLLVALDYLFLCFLNFFFPIK